MQSIPKRSSKQGAFTLVELLVVIVVISILAALTLGSAKFAKNKGAEAKTKGMIKMIELALEKYQLEYGEYPSGIMTAMVPGSSLEAGPAIELYKLITGDANNDGEIQSTEEPLIESGFAGLSDKFGFTTGSGVDAAGLPAGPFYLKDGWGNPIQYIHPNDAATFGHTMKNGTYDIFSYGADDPTSPGGGVTDARWIKNW